MGRLTAIVLGAAAGGGFPQWNCRCPVCRLAWDGDVRVKARTQASVAISADRERWTLLNAAPELRAQIEATSALHPDRHPSPGSSPGLRHSPIDAVVLTGAEVDQVTGLLSLRERQAFALYATAETLGVLADNRIFDALAPDMVSRRAVTLSKSFDLPGGLSAELFAVPGKVPLYLEGRDPAIGAETGATVGIEVCADGARLAFVPGSATITPALTQRLARADVVLFDGTLYDDDEMIRTGTGAKTGRRMGHMPIAGADGSLAALAEVPGRRIYIHINNTNPILVEGSPERQRVEAAGWEIAEDGMEIML
jgi:pyrroloquinoline quinone biosynthesis protein B